MIVIVKRVDSLLQPLVCCFLTDFLDECDDEEDIFERECDIFIHDFVIKIFSGR